LLEIVKDDMKTTVYRERDGGPVVNFLADAATWLGAKLIRVSLPYAKVHQLDLDYLNDAYYDSSDDGDLYDMWLDLERNQLENTDKFMLTHKKQDCKGEWCTIHKRSDHAMRSFPQDFRYDSMLMERVCLHGIGHPDPDDIKLTGPNAWAQAVHGCDGCCGMDIKKGK
jgi:hypothetical protein